MVIPPEQEAENSPITTGLFKPYAEATTCYYRYSWNRQQKSDHTIVPSNIDIYLLWRRYTKRCVSMNLVEIKFPQSFTSSSNQTGIRIVISL